MIEGGKYHDSLEEMFSLQNNAELQVISYEFKKGEKDFLNYLEPSFHIR